MNRVGAPALVATMLALASCSKSQELPHNAQFYREHPDRRTEMLKRCAADQNSENPADCVAAEDAERGVKLEQSLGH